MKKQHRNARFQPLAMTILVIVLMISLPTYAQSVSAGATSIVTKIINVINIIFPATLIFGVIYAVMGYIADAPNKHQRIIYLIIAIIIWYGFSMLIGDIQGSLGGNGKLDSGIVK
jgi:type IV secretory pathway VirB2 component (pilin)